jgi:hypothetical protein
MLNNASQLKDMNRELIVNLLKKNIDDLILLTEGFEEMNVYPRALINLAQMKANDIKEYLYELGELKPEQSRGNNEPEVQEKNDLYLQEQEISHSQVEEALDLPEEYPANEAPEIVAPDAEAPLGTLSAAAPLTIPLTEETYTLTPEEAVNIKEDKTQPEPVIETEPINEPETIIKAEPVTELQPTYDSNKMVEPKPVNEQKLTLGERLATGKSRNELHIGNDNNRLSSSLANKKIDDIRQAISLGDRFRFQRELFRGNGEDMNKMLSYINMLASYEEIESFLQGKYNWDKDEPTTQDFYTIVKRKFNGN